LVTVAAVGLVFLALDALEVRRALLVRHFDDQIGSEGEAAVMYD
jgi:hypothetical protein